MNSKYCKCPSCGSTRYENKDFILNGDSSYKMVFICRTCKRIWSEEKQLISNTNKYTMIWMGKLMLLHRLVYEKAHNITLDTYDVIHHLNRNRGDNRVSNLILMNKSSHTPKTHGIDNPFMVTCNKCGYKWMPRSNDTKYCPNCKTKYWNKYNKTTSNELQYENFIDLP